MAITRRQFLTRSGLTVGSFLLPGAFTDALAASVDPSKVLVTVFLRGAADSLNLVIPAGDNNYYDLRPHIAIGSGSEIPLDSFFGLNPDLSPLMPLYNSGQFAIVHAVGSPDPTRSHFDAQDYMQHAAPGDKTVRDGWLNRFVGAAGISGCFGAVTMGAWDAESMRGAANTLSMSSVSDFALPGQTDIRREGLEVMFGGPNPLHDAMNQAFGCLDVAAQVGPPSSGYPSSDLAVSLSNLAAVIKADVGLQAAAVDHLGWDTHRNELVEQAALATELSGALAAFMADLGSHASRTCVLVMTEFGRRVEENLSGTDHGHGSLMFVLGGGVKGGKVYLRDDTWPGLSSQDLYDGRDLQVTTDFRDVFGEVLLRFMGLGYTATCDDVLLGYTVPNSQMLGLFA